MTTTTQRKKLEGKLALITGGTSGIGFATAKVFHREGARVIVTGTNPASIARARDELRGVAEVISSNAADAASITELFEHVRKTYPEGLDVLFLNAGVVKRMSIEESSEALFDEVFNINIKGPWLALRAAIPLLRPGGAVVLNASINAHLGMPGSSLYAASKAALRSLARTAASELASRKIRVNALSPGPTDSGIIEKMGMGAEAVQATHEALTAQIPLSRLGTPEEIAKAALFLACDDSSFITGEEIVVDGGMTRV